MPVGMIFLRLRVTANDFNPVLDAMASTLMSKMRSITGGYLGRYDRARPWFAARQ